MSERSGFCQDQHDNSNNRHWCAGMGHNYKVPQTLFVGMDNLTKIVLGSKVGLYRAALTETQLDQVVNSTQD